MFTGLVEAVGRVSRVDQKDMTRLTVSAGPVLSDDLGRGDSVSVNGVCLTLSERDGETLVFYAMPETTRRSALGDLSEGSAVNLERAMSATDRFGGHIVQGHVDGVGYVLGVRPEGEAEIWEFGAPETVLRYVVEKGSICVDGISLTVVAVREGSFTVSILPQTRENTNLMTLRVGDRVNLEADVIAKYVERLLGPRQEKVVQDLERSVEDAV